MTKETDGTIVDKASFPGFVQIVANYFQKLSTENFGVFLDHFLVITFIGGLVVLLWRFCYLLYRSLKAAIAYRNLGRRFRLRGQSNLDRISGSPLMQQFQQMRDENDNSETNDPRAAGDSLARDVDQDAGRSQIMVMFLQRGPEEEENSRNNPPTAHGIIMAQSILEEMRRMTQSIGGSLNQNNQRLAQIQDGSEEDMTSAPELVTTQASILDTEERQNVNEITHPGGNTASFEENDNEDNI